MTDSITFSELQLAAPIQRALQEKNYERPSPIQAQAIPHLLEGKDLVGCAQTGTGKTAAFALPILHLLAAENVRPAPRKIRALILTPTRELAAQIAQNFEAYGRYLNLSHAVVFGGVGQNPQVRKLERGLDILVATPGRLLDLEQQGHVRFDSVKIFVLDEADRMLDMGFIHDVKKVLARLPRKRQSLLFSATMPPAIRELADRLLVDPVQVEVAPVSTTAERIEQRLCYAERSEKRGLLVRYAREHQDGLTLVFSRTKHGANRLVEQLGKEGIRAEAIHGNKSQTARERALDNFRRGRTRVLVATDIAARGIDVKGVTLVVNYDIPNEPEAYVHRIGRTARAGADGLAVSFCDSSERGYIRSIERLIRMQIPVEGAVPAEGRDRPAAAARQPQRRPGPSGGGRGPGGTPNRFRTRRGRRSDSASSAGSSGRR